MKKTVLNVEARVTKGKYKDSNLEITLKSTDHFVIGRKAEILMNGKDISHCVTYLDIRIRPNELVTLNLGLASVVNAHDASREKHQ